MKLACNANAPPYRDTKLWPVNQLAKL